MHQEPLQQVPDDSMPGVSEDLVKFFTGKATELSTARKLRGKALPETLAAAEVIKEYKETVTHDAIHSTSAPGITALDLQVRMFIFTRFSNSLMNNPVNLF